MTPKIPDPKPVPPPPTYADFAVSNAGDRQRSAAAGLRKRRSVLDEALPTLTADKNLLGQ